MLCPHRLAELEKEAQCGLEGASLWILTGTRCSPRPRPHTSGLRAQCLSQQQFSGPPEQTASPLGASVSPRAPTPPIPPRDGLLPHTSFRALCESRGQTGLRGGGSQGCRAPAQGGTAPDSVLAGARDSWLPITLHLWEVLGPLRCSPRGLGLAGLLPPACPPAHSQPEGKCWLPTVPCAYSSKTRPPAA